ncbi:hypothetical protein BLNAU_1028 [Blattamonas nauphoetae]|uniref:Uncharacterized protein n=1 Tax=Blattamonas nauphoetae TaxID=2049346 RepID=A0ABQ9YJY0_9EUKA|nr:hypothetical protein BLNAU_1028 [Blattamonas nauphoetae]
MRRAATECPDLKWSVALLGRQMFMFGRRVSEGLRSTGGTNPALALSSLAVDWVTPCPVRLIIAHSPTMLLNGVERWNFTLILPSASPSPPTPSHSPLPLPHHPHSPTPLCLSLTTRTLPLPSASPLTTHTRNPRTHKATLTFCRGQLDKCPSAKQSQRAGMDRDERKKEEAVSSRCLPAASDSGHTPH